MSQGNELVTAVQFLMALGEAADELEQAQARFDYAAIEALCEKNRALRPQLAQCLEGLKALKPTSPEERELVSLAVGLVRKVRLADKSFAIWQANLEAMRTWSADGAAQSLQNIPRLHDTCPVDRLDGRFTGVPAIIVAAGPSLDKNFHLLKEVTDRAVIITMNRCAKIFEGDGLQPHLLVASDRSATLPDAHLAGVEEATLQNLVLRPSVHPRMLDLPRTRTFLFTDGSSHESGLVEAIGHTPRAVGGGTVGHSCFLLAFHMGCNPIVLVGQDLAYSGERAYSSRDLDADKRLVVGEGGEVGAIRDPDGVASKHGSGYEFQVDIVPGWGGGEVRTSVGFHRFIDFYDVMLRAMREEREVTCINATEGGARLEGMEELTLRQAIDQHLSTPVEGIEERIAAAYADYQPKVARAQVAKVVRDLEGHMQRLHNLAVDGERLASSPKRNPRRLQRMQELQRRVHDLFAHCEYFIRDAYRGELSKAPPSEDVWEKAGAQFTALRDATASLLPGCRAATRALESERPG